MPKSTQDAYAKLLKTDPTNIDWGDGLYQPSPEPKIGDVAFFYKGTYHSKFNVWEMTEKIRKQHKVGELDVSKPAANSEGRDCKKFSSVNAKFVVLACRSDVLLPHATVGVDIRIETEHKRTAICIPASPIYINGIIDGLEMEDLLEWWRRSRREIYYNTDQSVGPVFLVTENTTTEQASTCYYEGKNGGTIVSIRGNVLDVAKLEIGTGFSCTEEGNSDFTFLHSRQQKGRPLTIFIKSEIMSGMKLVKTVKKKLAACLWWKKKSEQEPIEHPEWSVHSGSEETSKSEPKSSNGDNGGNFDEAPTIGPNGHQLEILPTVNEISHSTGKALPENQTDPDRDQSTVSAVDTDSNKTAADSQLDPPSPTTSNEDTSEGVEHQVIQQTQRSNSPGKPKKRGRKRNTRGRCGNDNELRKNEDGPNGDGGSGGGPYDSKKGKTGRSAGHGGSASNKAKGSNNGSQGKKREGRKPGGSHAHVGVLESVEEQSDDDALTLCVGATQYPQSFELSPFCSLVRLPNGEFTIDFYGQSKDLPDEVLDPTSGEFDAYVEKVLRASIEAFEPRIPKPLRAKAPAPLDLYLGDSLMALGAQISTMSLERNGPALPSVGKVSPFLVPEREHPLSPIQKFLTGTEHGLASIAKCLRSPTTPSNGWACYMSMSLSPTIAGQMVPAA